MVIETENILRCPHCGGVASLIENSNAKYSVTCNSCLCCTGKSKYKGKVVGAWNRRAASDNGCVWIVSHSAAAGTDGVVEFAASTLDAARAFLERTGWKEISNEYPYLYRSKHSSISGLRIVKRLQLVRS